ncbi:hypothetical protein [Arsenicibacter rosenii]|uniref:Uncharacterized protein n=1 Tax=Arsenicibacter rosenii TaxID=1750698 RepID=A0A1S2VEF6_9BACT|nr:hypothetical protein [Arsenicibacter rosenii]OIN56576.1 hypothetical protein BLX24_24220 [Arsenicibacter rosenii]
MKALFYTGLLCCFLVVANVTLWIKTATQDLPFEQVKARYLGYFPAFLQNALILTLLNIGLCGISVWLLSRSRRLPGFGYRGTSITIIGLDILLISWLVFTLM